MLAIVFKLQKFYEFIKGRKLTILTDHFKWMMESKKVNQLLNRWIVIIFSFDFEIQYIRGIKNVLPDALSRLFDKYDEGEGYIPDEEFYRITKG